VQRIRLTCIVAGLLALTAGCAASGMPDANGRYVMAVHASPHAVERSGNKFLFRTVVTKPDRRAGDRIRVAAMGWAQRYSVSVIKTETHRGSGLMYFSSPADDGRLELIYRHDDNEAWAVLSHVPKQGIRVRQDPGGDPTRLARQFAADALADAIEQALKPAEVAPAARPSDRRTGACRPG